jgi:hypothetical protein
MVISETQLGLVGSVQFCENPGMPLTKQGFFEKWVAVLKRPKKYMPSNWQGNHAIQELEEKEYAPDYVIGTPFAEDIPRECLVYNKHRQQIAQLNRQFREATELFRQSEKKFRSMEGQISSGVSDYAFATVCAAFTKRFPALS